MHELERAVVTLVVTAIFCGVGSVINIIMLVYLISQEQKRRHEERRPGDANRDD